ncbi:hypothetical protein CP975_04510 [Streptomyces alboniger]|uniref:Teneurin NHL domain-containing protein n=2 Tax=Streptomyces alboniger TaxID=132473 RepID=A0A5J6HTE2_STRAD|nr:hypothetical protein CP975_04510 [Streptomyces alboniger]
MSVVTDGAGNIFIGEFSGHRVRKVTPDGIIRTVAGTGQAGYSGDGGPATKAQLNFHEGIALGRDGSLYIADRENHRVRKVAADGTITTVAGTGQAGYDSDGQPAVRAKLNMPLAVAVDEDGNLYIADLANQRVRKVTPDGIIHTVAGNGLGGYDSDGGPAHETKLYQPNALALDAAGNLYISDRGNHRVRMVARAGAEMPLKPYEADLYGKAVAPHTVQRGQEFDLGAYVESRLGGADGAKVTVVLTLADGLVDATGTSGRRLSRTFPGTSLVPYSGIRAPGPTSYSLNGVFRVTAPRTTPPGTYVSTLEIQYAGELNLKDNVFTLPVAVVVPSLVQDETALEIRQETVPEVAAGQGAKFNVILNSPTGQPVNPGVIAQRFTAPTGFVFTGQPSYGYYDTVHGVITGNLVHRIEDDGRTLIVTDNPHVNTTTSDTGPLVYTIGVRALPGAHPGTVADGSASVGKHVPVQLSAKVTGPVGDETPLRYAQESVPELEPGGSTTFNIEIRSLDNQPVNPGTFPQRFTAPTGFAFDPGASYGYYYVKPAVTGNLSTRVEDGGKTLVVESNPHLNTGTTDTTALLYTLSLRALPDAGPGTYDDGRISVGRLAPTPITARVK